MANGNIEGKTWGIPFQRSTIVAYYNKDMFRAAGLDPESPPTSWDELISMGKALTKDGAHGIMILSTASVLDVSSISDPKWKEVSQTMA